MALKYLSDIQSARDPQQPTDVANKRYVDAAAGGTTILSGILAPTVSDGEDGDYYLDTDDNILYGPKNTDSLGSPQTAWTTQSPTGSTATFWYALGNDVTFASAGRITGMRFYRNSAATATGITLKIWASGGALLGTCATTGDTGSGWKTAYFGTPIVVTAGQTVRAVMESVAGSATQETNISANIVNGDLTLNAQGYYGTIGTYPTTGQSSDVMVDVIFQASGDVWPVALTNGGSSYSETISSGTTVVVPHGLNTKDVVVGVYRISDGVEVDVPFTHTSVNSITLSSVVDLGGHRVVVLSAGGSSGGGVGAGVGVPYLGEWSGDITYNQGDIVGYNDTLWIASDSTAIGIPPVLDPNVSYAPNPGSNNFANATVLHVQYPEIDVPITEFSNTGFTNESGEPLSSKSGATNQKSAWWSYTPLRAGTTRFTSYDSGGEPTTLGVWYGSTLSTLTEVVPTSGGTGGGYYDLVGGTTYYIQMACITNAVYHLDLTGIETEPIITGWEAYAAQAPAGMVFEFQHMLLNQEFPVINGIAVDGEFPQDITAITVHETVLHPTNNRATARETFANLQHGDLISFYRGSYSQSSCWGLYRIVDVAPPVNAVWTFYVESIVSSHSIIDFDNAVDGFFYFGDAAKHLTVNGGIVGPTEFRDQVTIVKGTYDPQLVLDGQYTSIILAKPNASDPTQTSNWSFWTSGNPQKLWLSGDDNDLGYNDIFYVVQGDPHLKLEADPVDPEDAATKAYVDDAIAAAGGGEPTTFTRTTTAFTTASLATNAAATGTVTLAAGYRLLSIMTSREARVRLYTTAAKRDADVARAAGTDPTGDHGLIIEYVTTTAVLSADLSPTVDGFDGKSTPDGVIYYSVTNLGGAGTVTVTFKWIRTE